MISPLGIKKSCYFRVFNRPLTLALKPFENITKIDMEQLVICYLNCLRKKLLYRKISQP